MATSYPPNVQYYQSDPSSGSPYNQGSPPPGPYYNQGFPPLGQHYNPGGPPPGPPYNQGAPTAGSPYNQGGPSLGPPYNQGAPPPVSPYNQGGPHLGPPYNQGAPYNEGSAQGGFEQSQELSGQPIVEQPLINQHQGAVPPGLEYLSALDQLMVKQKVEVLEVMIGFETANKYVVKNSLGQDIYSAKEENDCLTRQCCGPTRPFGLSIKDNLNREVIHLDRPLRCQSCCFPCCLQTMEVSSPPGTVIGYIKQEWTCIKPKFSIQDEDENTVLQIEGPFCTYSCFGDVVFKVLTKDGSEVGQISKQWTGMVKETFTDADNFGISFPLDLDVKAKATLLGAVFLIDFMYFESNAQDEGGLLTD